MSGALQIVVLGGDSGKGESVLIIADAWIIIVDSFYDKDASLPAPISYLQSISRSTSEVTCVIASHWHDDHIRGLDKVVELCTSADFFLSDALTSEEFAEIIVSEHSKPGEITSVRTIHNILGHLRVSGRPPKHVTQERIVWRDTSNTIEVLALSPSDKTIYDSRQQLAELLSEYSDLNVSIPQSSGNHFSVALLVSIKDQRVVLGGDLEVTTDPAKGWEAVCQIPVVKSILEVCFFKVPHHGSSNGYHDKIWNRINERSSVAITAYASSSLPRRDMIDQFKKHTNAIYLTFCQTNFKSSRVKGKLADKILENNNRIKYYRPNRSYNGVVFDSSRHSVTTLLRAAVHVDTCPEFSR